MSLPKKLLSIDIGNEWIKIAYIQKKGKKIHFLNGKKIPTPERTVHDGILSNLPDIAKLIRQALEQNHIKEKQVIFSIASSKIITREVELPNLSQKKLRNIIDLNADEYFPVNLAEYTLDYTVTEVVETEEGKKAKVIIVAALRKVIQSYIDLAELCQLNIVSVDFSGNSIVNFIQHEKYEGTNLFLNIASESTMVTIVSNGVVKFSRNILFGTNVIYESIQQHFNVDDEEAVKIAQERQLLNPEHKENAYLHNDVTSGMEQILNGVARLIDYYSTRNKSPIEQVYIMDGGSEIFGVEEYIAAYFGLKVKKITAFNNIVIKAIEIQSDEIHYYPTALGASLSSMNLLPINIKNKDELQAKKRIPILIGILLLVSIGAHYYTGYAQYQRLEREKSNIQNEISSMMDIYNVLDEYQQVLNEKQMRELIVDSTTTKSDQFLAFINELEATMPEQAFMTSINVSNEGITMSTSFNNEETLAQMLTYLKGLVIYDEEGNSSPMFASVYTPAVTRFGDEDSSVSYVAVTIQCTFLTQEEETDDQ